MSLMKEIEISYVEENLYFILLNTQYTAFLFLHVLVEQVTIDNVLKLYLM